MNDDKLASEAEAWLFRLRADDVTAVERQDFATWLAIDESHARAWNDAQALFGATLQPATEVHARLRDSGLLAAPRSRPFRLQAWTAACIAGLALLLAFQGPRALDGVLADASTQVGERRIVALNDGSVVELNTDSAMDVSMDGAERHVRLRRGEAFFQVAHDAARPFIVETAQGAVRVLGTRFSVAARNGETAVAVEDGIVAVSALTSPDAPRRLTRGEQARFDANEVSSPLPLDPTAIFAWRRGQVVFRQQSLSSLVAELNRYWPGKVVILNDSLAQRQVSGVFELDRQDDSLAALHALLGVEVTHVTPYLTLLH